MHLICWRLGRVHALPIPAPSPLSPTVCLRKWAQGGGGSSGGAARARGCPQRCARVSGRSAGGRNRGGVLYAAVLSLGCGLGFSAQVRGSTLRAPVSCPTSWSGSGGRRCNFGPRPSSLAFAGGEGLGGRGGGVAPPRIKSCQGAFAAFWWAGQARLLGRGSRHCRGPPPAPAGGWGALGGRVHVPRPGQPRGVAVGRDHPLHY